MTYRISGRGWLPDPLDHRDHTVLDGALRQRINRVVPALSRDVARRAPLAADSPSEVGDVIVDLRKWCSPIEDQGGIGSCTAHAVVGALEYFERKTRGKHVDASRLFLYRVTRRYLGWEGRGDTGAFLRSAIKALRVFGTVPESYWKYDEARFDEEPEAFHYAFAASFRALEYFRVPENVRDLRAVLDAGLPFVFGFTCFQSLEDDEVTTTGVIPYPRSRERSTGGHAVLAVGYTDSHVIIRNSWGRSWGQRGYGYLPWTYFDGARRLADDCWALVNAEWMPEDEGEEMPADLGVRLAPTTAIAESLQPVVSRSPARENEEAQIQVSQGVDVIRGLPLCLVSPRTGGPRLGADPGASFDLRTSSRPVALYLRQLELLDSFDWALFGRAVNELYLITVVWDLSGAPPLVFPSAVSSGAQLRTYDLKRRENVRFLGDGIQLWPERRIVGGLHVRLVVMESDSDVRAMGERIGEIHSAVTESGLPTALSALAATTVAAPVLAAVGAAADVLTRVLASVLRKNDDDLVALFDGTYGAESLIESRTERYQQAGAAITLDVKVSSAEPDASTEPVADKRRRKKKK